MKIYLFYRPQVGMDLAIDTFLKLLDRHKSKLQVINVDSRQGDQLSRLYDLMDYPSVVVVRDDGVQVESWQGKLPYLEDLNPYLQQM
ncbi:MAG: hypothetical protein OXF30_00485 [Candidatus Saccharibacteria bacterium]|nr:hypothetical protein [Candidatus Saccharibacteria bacterium]